MVIKLQVATTLLVGQAYMVRVQCTSLCVEG